MNISNKLKQYMAKEHMKPVDVAHLVGVTENTVRLWLKNGDLTKIEHAQKLYELPDTVFTPEDFIKVKQNDKQTH